MPAHFLARCLDCGGQAEFDQHNPACPQCGSYWREAVYDYAKLSKILPLRISQRPFDLWRYQELLPLSKSIHSVQMGEGGTPLIHAASLGSMLGNPNIYIRMSGKILPRHLKIARLRLPSRCSRKLVSMRLCVPPPGM